MEKTAGNISVTGDDKKQFDVAGDKVQGKEW
jgi:hypothetical protein